MTYWKVVKIIENKRIYFLCLALYPNQYLWIPSHFAWLYYIMLYVCVICIQRCVYPCEIAHACNTARKKHYRMCRHCRSLGEIGFFISWSNQCFWMDKTLTVHQWFAKNMPCHWIRLLIEGSFIMLFIIPKGNSYGLLACPLHTIGPLLCVILVYMCVKVHTGEQAWDCVSLCSIKFPGNCWKSERITQQCSIDRLKCF